MDQQPHVLVARLNRAGLNDREIAERLCERGVPVTPETINRIKNRRFKSTKFEIGMGLLQLHNQVSAPRPS